MVDAKLKIFADVSDAKRRLLELVRGEQDLKKAADATGRAAASAQKAIIDNTRAATKEIERGTSALERYEQAFGAASKRSAAFGDIDSSIGAIRGVVGTVSPETAQQLTVAQDLFAAREGIERLGPGIKFVGEQAAASSGLVGGLASGLQGAIPGLSAASAGLGAIALAAAPLALAAGGLALVFRDAAAQAEIANAASQEFFKTRQAEIDNANLSTEEAQKRLDELKASETSQTEIVRDANAAREEIFRQLQDESSKSFGVFGDLSARLKTAFFDASGGFDKFEEGLDGAKSAASDAKAEIAALEKLLKDGTTAENDRAAAIEKATKELEAGEKALEAARQQQITTLAQLEAQETALNIAYTKGVLARGQRRLLEDERRKEDEALARDRAQQDLDKALEAQAAAHEQNLEAIAKRGNDAILAARNDLAAKEADALKRITVLQDEFRREEAKAEARFAKERKRELDDYRKARKRALEDQRADELNALIENDITSIITGRSQFRRDRRRERDDFREGRGRGREDFEEERAAARAALEQKIVDIRTEVNEYRLATETKIAQIRAQTEQELALAQAAYETRLEQDAEERRIQNERDAEDSRIENERRSRDREIEDAAARNAHIESLGRIEAQRVAANAAYDQAIAKVAALQAAINSLTTNSTTTTTSSSKVNPYAISPENARFYEDAGTLDSGGIVTRPSFGKLAMNRKPEAVIPLAQLPQMMGNMGGAVNINLPAPQVVDFGGIKFVTYEQHEASIRAIGQGINNARSQRTRR